MQFNWFATYVIIFSITGMSLVSLLHLHNTKENDCCVTLAYVLLFTTTFVAMYLYMCCTVFAMLNCRMYYIIGYSLIFLVSSSLRLNILSRTLSVDYSMLYNLLTPLCCSLVLTPLLTVSVMTTLCSQKFPEFRSSWVFFISVLFSKCYIIISNIIAPFFSRRSITFCMMNYHQNLLLFCRY